MLIPHQRKRRPEWLKVALRKDIVIRSSKIALVVGTVLAALNHGDKFLVGQVDMLDTMKMLITYMVPFCVSTYSSVQNELTHYD